MLSLARSALARPWPWLAGCLVVIALIGGGGLSRLVIDTDGAVLDDPRHPAVVAGRADRLRFDDPDQAILLVTPRSGGPPLASVAGLGFLLELDQAVRRLPSVHAAGVRSVADLRRPEFGPESLSAEPFLVHAPTDEAAARALVAQFATSPWAAPALFAADGQAAAIVVPLAADGERRQLVTGLRGLTDDPTPFELSLLGPVVAEIRLGEAVVTELASLIPLSALVMAALLAWRLRSLGGVLVPLAAVGAVLVLTFGTMGLAGVPVTLVTTPLPVLLQALLVVESIHLGERLAERLRTTSPLDRPAIRRLAGEVLAELERPLVATFLTTAIGFASFVVTPLPALRQFGLFGAVGVLVGLLACFTLVPALYAVLPVAALRPRGAAPRATSGLFRGASRLGIAGPIVVGVLVVLSSPLWARLEVGDNWTGNLAPTDPLVQADRTFNEHFWGSWRIDVVAHGPEEFFATPAGVAWVGALETAARAEPDVAGVLSHRTALGELAAAAGHDGVDRLSPDEISGLLGLVEMTQDPRSLRQFLTPDAAWARLQLFVKGEDFRRDRALVAALEGRLAAVPAPPGASWRLAGDIPEGLAMVDAVVRGQVGSIALTYAVLGLLLFTVYPRGRAAWVVLAPVVATTALLFAGMGWLGIPLGIATSMFGSLVAELGTDVGLHLVHAHRGDGPGAVAATFERVGPALTTVALVLGAGYLVLGLSALRPNRSLGFLLAAAIVVTLAAAVACFAGLARWLGPRNPAPALLGLGEEVT